MLCGTTRIWHVAFVLAFGLSIPAQVWAQSDEGFPQEDYDPDEDYDGDEIIVTGQQQILTAVSGITPDVSFGTAAIQSLGATDVGELIDAINAEVGNGENGPPVILLNGRPVESRREIQRFPSEAIRRVDVLPPEASLKYSSSPDRRVLNFVLKKRFNALTQDAKIQTTTDGGRESANLGANFLRIHNKTRLAFSLDYTASDSLSESERYVADRDRNGPYAFGGNITAVTAGEEIDANFSADFGEIITAIGVPEGAASSALSYADFQSGANRLNLTDEQDFRDLEAKKETLNMSASIFRPIGNRLSFKAALNAEASQSDSQRGLIRTRFDIPAASLFSPFQQDVRLYRADGPLLRKQTDSDVDGSVGLYADYADWRWSINGQYTDVRQNRDTARRLDIDGLQTRLDQLDPAFNPYGDLILSGNSISDRIEKTVLLKGLISGRIAQLWAGPMTGTIGANFSDVSLHAASDVFGVRAENALSRSAGQVRAEADIPLAGHDSQSSRARGRVSARLSGSVDEVEAVGTLVSYGGGLNWNASKKLRLQGSLDVQKTAPSLATLGNPVLIDSDVRVTDFATGNAFLVDRITGGNPSLEPETKRDIKLTANYRHSRALRMSMRYQARRIDNDVRSFPFLTPQIFEAFSDRLERDSNGDLIRFDARPVNAFLSERETLRSGFNWSKRFRRPESQSSSSSSGSGSTTGSKSRGRSNYLSVSLYHTLRMKEDVQFRQRGPVLDFLDGAALSRRGGQPIHELEGRVNFRGKNYGGGLFAAHESGKVLETSSISNQNLGDLTFAPQTKVNVRAYYDLGRKADGRRVSRESWRRDLRVTLDVKNIGNSRPSVSSETGVVPFGYEPAALDPQGRIVMLSLRKMFSTRPNKKS